MARQAPCPTHRLCCPLLFLQSLAPGQYWPFLAPGGRAGLAVLSCSVSRRGFRMGEGAGSSGSREIDTLGKASKPQITHFIQPKVEETVQVGAWRCHPGLPMRLLPTVPAVQLLYSAVRAEPGWACCSVMSTAAMEGSSWESVEQELLISQGDFPGLLAWQEWCRRHLQDRWPSDLQQPDHSSSGAVVLGFASQPSLSHC